MAEPLLIAKGSEDLFLLPGLVNRHGLVAGATGTGKTVTLQVMAECLSRIGVPVFAADVKGDLSGISKPGTETPKLKARVEQLKHRGLPVRRLPGHVLGRFRQTGPSDARHCFRDRAAPAQPHPESERHAIGRPFPHLQDCGRQRPASAGSEGSAGDAAVRRAQAKQFQTEYGNISAASIGAIQRGLVDTGESGWRSLLG